jgi:hypothetical protein
MVKGVVVHYLRWQALCQSQVLRNASLNDPRPRNLRHGNAAPLQAICAGPLWLETSQELIHFLDQCLDSLYRPVEGFLLLRVQF